MFGGGKEQDFSDDLFILDVSTTTWTKVSKPSDKPWPSKRQGHQACYDRQYHKMFLFGGVNSNGALNDLWSLELRNGNQFIWEELHPSGTLPSPRAYHSVCVADHKILVFGGSNGLKILGDLFIYDMSMYK